MNNYSKISLTLLLVPIYSICSGLGSKSSSGPEQPSNTGNLTFFPKGRPAVITTNNPINPTAGMTASTLELGNGSAAAAAPAVAVTTVNTSSILGTPYKRPVLPVQTEAFKTGMTGDGKWKGENGTAYLLRIALAGKLADACSIKPGSVASKDERILERFPQALKETGTALLAQMKLHSDASLRLALQQRADFEATVGTMHLISKATEKVAPGTISDGCTNSMRDLIREIRHEKAKNLEIMLAELAKQEEILRELDTTLVAQHPNPSSLRPLSPNKTHLTSSPLAPEGKK